MDQANFNFLVSEISSALKVRERFGTPITIDLINEKTEMVISELRADNIALGYEASEADVDRLKFHVGSSFNVQVGEAAISLHNPDLPRWFDSKKLEIDWHHWDAYRSMLASQGRSSAILDANEDVINDILDYSGDPKTPGNWARKGLVMGNVQSGKTQNYIGLINKSIDAGYKIIILLGGHINELRKQTQERVDEGVLGRESKHIVNAQTRAPIPIGVGAFRENSINTLTTTMGDFNNHIAMNLGIKLNGETVVIATIKKHAGIMERLYDWIKDYHFLDPDTGKALDGPLLLIDDEADYASINTKHHKEEVTKTNESIRHLLSLFRRNTYIGYTATPFANIFIDPDSDTHCVGDDLFPSDFMIKMPVPDNYTGQDFFFSQDLAEEREESQENSNWRSPTIPITDCENLYALKKDEYISVLPESLKQAIRAFILVIAVRSIRGERFVHNTMLVNISHLTVHQNRLEFLIDAYHKEIEEALDSFAGLGREKARSAEVLRKIEETFSEVFFIGEDYAQVFEKLRESSVRVKVWAVNRSRNRELNYSIHKEHGLCAIVIGGHKLSRGLTLEGLSISYFTRNSKAYDTLMQMCRWFGYRPKYDDLCRVYLPPESIEWYSFISLSIRELYQELELMSKRNQRPKDFGLKVREHPGAMVITAKNKIGWGESQIRLQDLWGQVQRRFKFRSDADINRRNLAYTKKFIQRLIDEGKGEPNLVPDNDSGALVFSEVEYSDLIEYVKNMELPEDNIGNNALISHLDKMSKANFGKPKVVLFNRKDGRRKVMWEGRLDPQDDLNFINTKYKFLPNHELNLSKRRMFKDSNNDFRVRSVHLGNPDDEKYFLSSQARDAVIDSVGEKPGKSAVNFDYLSSDERDFPGLLIYLFAVAVGAEVPPKLLADDVLHLGHGRMPTVGYTLSLPRSDNLKGKTKKEIDEIIKNTKHSYQVSKVYYRNLEFQFYADIEDDE